MTCMVLFPGKTKAKLVEKWFKKIRKYRKFPIFTHHLRTFCETFVRMFVSVAYISVRMFLRKYVSETGPRCGLTCGHPFSHNCVGVSIKDPEPSPSLRFPSEVKRFRPSIRELQYKVCHTHSMKYSTLMQYKYLHFYSSESTLIISTSYFLFLCIIERTC